MKRCDKCGNLARELFAWDGEEICIDCLDRETESVCFRCDECGDAEVLHEYNGQKLCFVCLCNKLKVHDCARETDDSPDPMDIARAWAVDHL